MDHPALGSCLSSIKSKDPVSVITFYNLFQQVYYQLEHSLYTIIIFLPPLPYYLLSTEKYVSGYFVLLESEISIYKVRNVVQT